MDDDSSKSLERKLDVIIHLLLKNSQEYSSLRDQISFLDNLNLRPIEIAQILGKTQKHIGKELVGIRKLKSKK